MSWFIGILKHIFGSGDEERKEIRRNQSQSENSLGSCAYPNREIDNYSVSTRNAVRSSNSAADFAISNKNSVVASVSALPSSQKLASVGQESCSEVLQRNKVNKITEQKFLDNVLSASSQSSQSSCDSVFSLHSHKPPSVTTKSTLPSISKKSSEDARQPKGEHLSSSNCSVPQSMVPNRATNKLTDQKLNSHVSDASSTSTTFNPLQSSSRLPPFPGWSSELFASTLENEKSVSSLEKDPLPFSPSPTKIHCTKPPPISTKPTISLASSSSTSQENKTNYVWVEKSASSTYVFPDDIKSSIEKDIVPGVLKMPLSMSTYKDYFHSLLYAEDYYLEKWDGFEMKNVTLELHEAEIYMRKGKPKSFIEADGKDEKLFVAFEIDKIPERRPFLLSRDFVSVKPSSRKIEAFQGLIYRVVKSNLVLAEFGENFYSQHHPACEYDVNFSFNRVCLKRAHQAIAAASDLLYKNLLFPGFAPTHDHELPFTQLFPNYRNQKDALAVRQISRLQGAPPYLVEGPISVVERVHLSRTGKVIVEAVLQVCRTSASTRILLCAPLNNTCDVLMRALKKEMEEFEMFRANAAFREIDGVPGDILPSCLYEEERDCFACPSLEELKKYKVISSTFMSSFRLRDEGMVAGHFSHIFLVDASSATEPETMVPLANFATSETIVVVTGAPGNRSGWVRSKIARENGLRISYFERLRESELYKNQDPRVITQLEDLRQKYDEIYSSLPPFLI